MKKEIADKWVEELTNGNYQQARSTLKCGDSYCCLGVLCDIYIKETGKAHWEFSSNISGKFVHEDDNSLTWRGAILPEMVLEWAEIRSSVCHIPKYANNLVNFNDAGSSFEEIASIIRENWEEL